MNKNIVTSFIVGVCITVAVLSVWQVIQINKRVTQNEIVIQQVVEFINKSIETQKQNQVSVPVKN